MNRREFLEALEAQLISLPEAEREQTIRFYAEMIDDRVEGGADEEEVVAQLGPVEQIAGEILQSAPPIPVRARAPRKWRGWEIALLAVGSPVWLPLLLAAGVVALALLIVLWALVVALWAMTAGIALAAPMSVAASGLGLLRGNLLNSFVGVGMGCIMAGAAIPLLFATKRATRGALWLTRTCREKIRRAG